MLQEEFFGPNSQDLLHIRKQIQQDLDHLRSVLDRASFNKVISGCCKVVSEVCTSFSVHCTAISSACIACLAHYITFLTALASYQRILATEAPTAISIKLSQKLKKLIKLRFSISFPLFFVLLKYSILFTSLKNNA